MRSALFEHEYPNVAPVDPLAVLRVAAVNRTTGRKHGFELIGGGGAGHNIDLGGAVPQLDVRFGFEVEDPTRCALATEVGAEQGKVVADRHGDQGCTARLPGFAANRREVDDGQTGQQFGGGRRVAGELLNGTVDRLERLRKEGSAGLRASHRTHGAMDRIARLVLVAERGLNPHGNQTLSRSRAPVSDDG